MVDFLLGREKRSATDLSPNTSLLEYLRDELGLCGTKEGCASGDCGACTVVLGHSDGERMHYESVNACITMLPTVHGKQVIAVEHLGNSDELHPVQQAMVDSHGSQCGFCTPGIVMSLFGLYKNSNDPTRKEIVHSLSGNLCRCTGYKPIVAAAANMHADDSPDQFDRLEEQTLRDLKTINVVDSLELHVGGQHYYAPSNLAELADLYDKNPHAHLLAGGTDLMLEITQLLSELSPVIYVKNVRELKDIWDDDDCLVIGAAAPFSAWLPIVSAYYPDFGKVLERFGSLQIRNVGTIGGNLATASPIGDTLPALLALDAVVALRKGDRQRDIGIVDFFVGYRQTALEEGELIESIKIPKPLESSLFCMFKVSKRPDDDISAVCAAFRLEMEGDCIKEARVAFGGVAEIPCRATSCEQSLTGQPWVQSTVEEACEALAAELRPISDIRASARYRLTIAKNLLRKCFLESQSSDQLRVIES